MKKLAILSGAIVAGLLAFSPANAGVSTSGTIMLYTDAGTPLVTQAHYRHRYVRRKVRRSIRRHRRYDYYAPRPIYRSYRHYDSYWGYHDHRGHRRRGGVGLYFNF